MNLLVLLGSSLVGWFGDFNVEPTKIPCLAKGITAGLCVDLEASWALDSGRAPGVTCKQDFESSLGS